MKTIILCCIVVVALGIRVVLGAKAPTRSPSKAPTIVITIPPSCSPTTIRPTFVPSFAPSQPPSFLPSAEPTDLPTFLPTVIPSPSPTASPTDVPTEMPTDSPTVAPSQSPSECPTNKPSVPPSPLPSVPPSPLPSQRPSPLPSVNPSISPTSSRPSRRPSTVPTNPTFGPTKLPTYSPTTPPTASHSPVPSQSPTITPSRPSCYPSTRPSDSPTKAPTTRQPTTRPTTYPSICPTIAPSKATALPSRTPSFMPTIAPITKQPTVYPTAFPSILPTLAPSRPTCGPSYAPSCPPTTKPTTSKPTTCPTTKPTKTPTIPPTTFSPSTRQPSTYRPTCTPTTPTSAPTFAPTIGNSLDWWTFGFDNQRTGSNPVENTLTSSNAANLTLAWTIPLRGGAISQVVVAVDFLVKPQVIPTSSPVSPPTAYPSIAIPAVWKRLSSTTTTFSYGGVSWGITFFLSAIFENSKGQSTVIGYFTTFTTVNTFALVGGSRCSTDGNVANSGTVTLACASSTSSTAVQNSPCVYTIVLTSPIYCNITDFPSWAPTAAPTVLPSQSLLSSAPSQLPTASPTFGSYYTSVGYLGDELGNFYAIDISQGSIIWEVNLGYTASSCADLPNGDFGISATAVLDRLDNIVYTMGGTGSFYALSMQTGAILWSLTNVYNSTLLHPYGGLTLTSRRYLYVAFAGLCDAGKYRSSVLTIDVVVRKVISEFLITGTTSDFGGGVWGTGGVSLSVPTATSKNVSAYIATGNCIGGSSEGDAYCERVVKLSTPRLSALAKSAYVNSNPGDNDFGATAVYINPSATSLCHWPLVVAMRKDGGLFVCNATTTAIIQIVQVSTPSGAGQFVGSPAWDAYLQVLVVPNPQTNTGYTPTFKYGLVALKLGSNCQFTKLWNTQVGRNSPGGNFAFSPPTIAGPVGKRVVYVSTGLWKTIHAVNMQTGALLWTYSTVGQVYGAPTVVNGTVLVTGLDYAGSAGRLLYAFRSKVPGTVP